MTDDEILSHDRQMASAARVILLEAMSALRALTPINATLDQLIDETILALRARKDML